MTYNRELVAERLEDLRKPEGKTISLKQLSKEIEDKTGIYISATQLNKYENPEKSDIMNVENLIAISDYYEVSYEYLLGKSDAKKRKNIDIHERTGLSDDAISKFENWNESVDYMDFDSGKITTKDVNTKAPDELNKMIESSHFRELIDYIRALNYTDNYDFEKYPQLKNRTIGPYKINILKEELGRNNTRNYIVYLIQLTIKELVDKLIPNTPIADDTLNATQADFKDNIDLIIDNWASYKGETTEEAIESISNLPHSYVKMLGDYMNHKKKRTD